MLISFLGYYSAQKQGGKKDTIGLVGSGSIKLILILLIKVVIVQVKISIIEIRKPGLQ